MRLPKPTYEQIGAAVAGTIAFQASLLADNPNPDPFEMERACDNQFIAILAAEVGGPDAGNAVMERISTEIIGRAEHRAHLSDFFDDADAEEIAGLRRELEKVARGNTGGSA